MRKFIAIVILLGADALCDIADVLRYLVQKMIRLADKVDPR